MVIPWANRASWAGLFSRFGRPVSALLLAGLVALVPPLGAAESQTIVFFGDSLTAGYGLGDPSTQAYPALIQAKLSAAGLPWRVVNAGLSGETTSGGARRVDWILRQSAAIFVVALGGNDGLRGIRPDVARANLETILERVHAKYPTAKLVVAGMKMPREMGPDFATAFENIFPAVAAKHQAVLIPFLLEGVGGSATLNQPDRIHPTAEGHALVAETVWKALRPLL